MDPQDVRILEMTRQRLSQLVTAMDGLRADLINGNPLPSWDSLQEKASAVSYQFQQVASHLQKNDAFFSTAHSYPLPSFPDKNHHNIVGQLLRKKLEPDVERWVDEGERLGRRVDGVDGEESGAVGAKELDDIWGWAAERAVTLTNEIPWGIDYTLEERDREGGTEGVVTGMKRKLNDGMEEVDEDEEENESEEKEAKQTAEAKNNTSAGPVAPPMPLEYTLRFMNTGHALPTWVWDEDKKKWNLKERR